MNELALSTISLFSGVGMLDEGFRAGLEYMGIGHRTICHVEREAHAAAVLVARMEEGSMDAAPIWSDITTFPARRFRGKVDGIVAGFPCQDISVAGARKGLDGERSGLFFEIPRIADDCGAWFMFLENVAGISSAAATVVDEAEGELDERAAARVVGELADLGWDAEWINVSASDVGANHGRERWFCFAWRMDDSQRPEWRPARSGVAGSQQGNDGGRTETHGRAGVAIQVLDHADRAGAKRSGREEPSTGFGCEELGNAAGIHGDWIGASSHQAGSAKPTDDGCAMADTGSTGLQIGIRGG